MSDFADPLSLSGKLTEQPLPVLGADGIGWFCVRSKPKHEHIAAAGLRLLPQVEVFNPRIRYKRPTRKGPAWVTESLFTNYLFARFNLNESLTPVRYSRGVCSIVHFGNQFPLVPDQAIEELRLALGEEETHLIQPMPVPGEEVQIVGGPFDGLRVLVERVMPSGRRVAALLDFLGRQSMVELDLDSIIRPHVHPLLPSDPEKQ